MGWNLAGLRRRLTLYALGGVVALLLLVLALVYLAIAIHGAWALLLQPPVAALCTAGSLLLLIGLLAAVLAPALRRRRSPRSDLLSEGATLTRRHPYLSMGAAFAAGVAASRSEAAEAALTAALLQAVRER